MPDYIICANIDMTSGIESFYVCYRYRNPSIFDGSFKSLATQYENISDVKLLEDEEVTLYDIEPNILYYRNIEIPKKTILDISKVEPNPWLDGEKLLIDATFVYAPNEITFKINYSEALKKNEEFLNLKISENYKEVYTIRDLLNKSTTLTMSKINRIRFSNTFTEDLYNLIKSGFSIEIYGYQYCVIIDYLKLSDI